MRNRLPNLRFSNQSKNYSLVDISIVKSNIPNVQGLVRPFSVTEQILRISLMPLAVSPFPKPQPSIPAERELPAGKKINLRFTEYYLKQNANFGGKHENTEKQVPDWPDLHTGWK